jgi:predicted MFS family arabinose efflux permease
METNHPAASVSPYWDVRAEERIAAGKAVLCGFAALFAGIGLARFGYAPFVPALVQARWFTAEQAGYLGAANLMGYVLGALFARRLARLMPIALLLRASMVVVGLHFLACSWATSFAWFFGWRMGAGIAGGVLMVLAAPTAIALSYPLLRSVAGGVVFTGLGLGTALSGIAVPALARIGLATAWRSLSGIVFLLTCCCWNEFRSFSSAGISERPASNRAVAQEPEFEWNQLWLLIATYSASAIGFVAHTVFWVDFIARGLGLGITAGGHYWTILGLSAACGPFLAGVVANRTGFRKALRWSLLVNAIGVAMPLLSTKGWALGLSSVATGGMAFGIVPLAAGRAMELMPHSRRQQQLWAWMTAAFSVAYAGNAYLFSFLFSRTGSFQLLFMIGSAVLLIGYGLDSFARAGLEVENRSL